MTKTTKVQVQKRAYSCILQFIKHTERESEESALYDLIITLNDVLLNQTSLHMCFHSPCGARMVVKTSKCSLLCLKMCCMLQI